MAACADSTVTSFGRAFDLVKPTEITLERYLNALPEAVRLALKKIFAERRMGAETVRRAERQFVRTVHRNTADESKRGARVAKLLEGLQ